MTERAKLQALHKEMCQKAFDLMERKNHDYASDEDPYRNFRQFGLLGILVRMSDKLARAISFVEHKGVLKVTEESIMDTFLDVINYAILFVGYYQSTRNTPQNVTKVNE